MSDFRKALLWTAVPMVALSLISLAGVATNPKDEGAIFGFGLMWLVAALWWLLASMAAIGYRIASEKQKMAGVLAGLGIGIVALSGTCFAMTAVSPFLSIKLLTV